MSRDARALLLLIAILSACGGEGPAGTPDAGPAGEDAGPPPPEPFAWQAAPDHPEGVAFGSAMVLPANGIRYLYVFGGVSGGYFEPGTYSSAVRRAQILGDHSLGPWEDAGTMSTGTSPIPLGGHDAIRIRSELGEDGVAIAGGGIPTSALPLILVGYVDPTTASLTHWGRFTPMLDVGQRYASWDPFEPHSLALVGGTIDNVPTDSVKIAIIEAGAMSSSFLDGPALPSARFGHASVVVGGQVYLFGGATADGPINEILRTTRDADGHVDGWTAAGELTSNVVFSSAVAHGDSVFVIGGLVSDPQTGPASVRVLSGTLDASGDLGTVGQLDGASLPEPLAASLVATDDDYVYVVGGIASGDGTASAHVYWARLP